MCAAQIGTVVLFTLGFLNYTEADQDKRKSVAEARESPRRKGATSPKNPFLASGPGIELTNQCMYMPVRILKALHFYCY